MKFSLQQKKRYATRKFRYLISKNSIGRGLKILWNRYWQKVCEESSIFADFSKFTPLVEVLPRRLLLRCANFCFLWSLFRKIVLFDSNRQLYKNNGIFWLQFFCGWYIERCSSVERFSTEGESLSASKRGNEARRAIQTEPERTKWV